MRVATGARLLLGVACLIGPRASLRVVAAREREDAVAVVVVRALGCRLVLQGAADLAFGARTRRPDAAIDLTHALSMVAAARVFPDHRRSALASASVAGVLAALDAASAYRARPRCA